VRRPWPWRRRLFAERQGAAVAVPASLAASTVQAGVSYAAATARSEWFQHAYHLPTGTRLMSAAATKFAACSALTIGLLAWEVRSFRPARAGGGTGAKNFIELQTSVPASPPRPAIFPACRLLLPATAMLPAPDRAKGTNRARALAKAISLAPALGKGMLLARLPVKVRRAKVLPEKAPFGKAPLVKAVAKGCNVIRSPASSLPTNGKRCSYK
jgi:hypothetical protein